MFKMKTETPSGKGRRDGGLQLPREQSSGQAGSGGLVPSAGFDPQVLTGSRGLQEWWWVPRGQCRGETSRGNEA